MSVKFDFNFRKSYKSRTDTAYSRSNDLFFAGDNGKAVILIHGLTGTPHEMKFLANFLNRKGYTVICPRLANHGEPLGILKNTKWQEFYQSAREAFLKASEKYESIFVGGLSMGALFALLLAEEFPQKVAGVICLSPTLFYDGWNNPWYQCFLPLASVTFLKHFSYYKEDPPYGIKNERVRQLVHKYYHNASVHDLEGVERYGYPYFPVSLLHQLHLLVGYLSKRLANITTPVQLIQAKDDDLTSVKNSQFIYDRVKSKIKEIVLLYDSYHVITADQERDKVAQEMERFFRQVLGEPEALKKETLEISENA